MADQRKEIRRFLSAARQGLDTALFLLKHQYNLLDAMYLAGYAVECGLKSLILRWTRKGDFSSVLSDLIEVGKKGHDFEYLKGLLKKRMGKRGSTDRESFGK